MCEGSRRDTLLLNLHNFTPSRTPTSPFGRRVCKRYIFLKKCFLLKNILK
jgi:hypothetical protein